MFQSDLLGDLFGGAAKFATRTRDRTMALRVSLRDLEGVDRALEIERFLACADCLGRGAPASESALACNACGGSGQHSKTQGFFTTTTTCQTCGGRGEQFETGCAACGGTGGERRRESLTVKIPSGVAEGQTLRLRGKGDDLADGEGPGDLHLLVELLPHEDLVRKGDDLRALVQITAEQARDGGSVWVPLPEGTWRVELPPRTQTGHEIRLAGLGLPRFGAPHLARPTQVQLGGDPYRAPDLAAHRGDLVVRIVVEGEDDEWLPYAALGLLPGATRPQIDAAYRAMAVRLHPDRNAGDLEATRRFQRVSEAYRKLTGTAPAGATAPAPRGPTQKQWAMLVICVAVVLYFFFR